MRYAYTPKYAPNLSIQIETGEEPTIIRIDNHGEWVGDHVEEILMEQHGDKYIAEAEAELKDRYENDLAEFLFDQRWTV